MTKTKKLDPYTEKKRREAKLSKMLKGFDKAQKERFSEIDKILKAYQKRDASWTVEDTAKAVKAKRRLEKEIRRLGQAREKVWNRLFNGAQ